ncbi:MAG: aldo/keto reductase [Chloroflexi bacterium]|nr:aldo/keto reductase [Chloroflexota bacterium]
MSDTCRLGATGITVGRVGVGTWQWGDTKYWKYGRVHKREDVEGAFAAARDADCNLFDSAEIYGRGESERILGPLARASRGTVVATKYWPSPRRFRSTSVDDAIDRSLARLGLDTIDLYQIHWPMSLIPHRRLAQALARAVRDRRVRAVGVSNFTARAMRRMHARLADLGVPLASNQVEYSLLRRAPETNGVLKACQELNVTLLAYSPLAQGMLTGNYHFNSRPGDGRRWSPRFRDKGYEAAAPVVDTLTKVAERHDCYQAQVALAWLLRHPGVVVIPGAKYAEQARTNAAALDITLTPEDERELDVKTEKFKYSALLARPFMG